MTITHKGYTMSKKNNSKKGSSGPQNVDVSAYTWDELKDLYVASAEEIIKQQKILVTAISNNGEVINVNPELSSSVRGAVLSLKDLSVDLNKIADQHSEIVGGARVFKTGALENEDNFLTGLNLGARYVDVTAKITDIASASYMDIVARINTSPELVKQYTNNLQKTIDDGADKVVEAYSGLNALAGVESNTNTAESNNE